MPDQVQEPVKFGIPTEEPAPEPKPRDSQGRFVDQAQAKLLSMARDAGVPEDEIASSSPEELRQAIKVARLEQQLNQRFESLGSIFDKQKPAEPAPVSQKFDGEDDWAPTIAAQFKAQAKQIEALKEELANSERRRAGESFAQSADRVFAELASDYAQVGKGHKDDFEPDSREIGVRRLILEEASRLAGKGATQPQILRKIRSAAEALFGPRKPETPLGDGKITIKEWQEAALAKPSHRHEEIDDSPQSDAKATSIVAAYLARTGKR